MPTAANRGVDLRYERAGSGEPVVLVPTLGYGPWQWSWQFPAVAGPFEAIAPVLRGTEPGDAPAGDPPAGDPPAGDPNGSSDGGPDRAPDVATLAADLEAVLADAGAERAHLVGLGLGGHVALEHAARYDRATSLALIATTPGASDARPPDAPDGELPDGVVDRLFAPRDDPAALRATLEPVLSEEFREAQPDVVDGIVEWRAEEDAPRETWERLAPAFEAWERDWAPYEVDVPALVCHGTADAVVPPANAEALAAQLPDVEVERFEGAGHLVGVERSRPLNDRLVGFLEAHGEE